MVARRIVGCRVWNSLRTDLVLDALEQAMRLCTGTEGLVQYSDRGTQYLSICYTERVAAVSIESVARMTMPWRKPSSVCLRPRSSGHENRDDISMRVNMQLWNGWTGSTLDAYSNELAICHRSSLSRYTKINWIVTLKRSDSHKRVSGISGAAQNQFTIK